MSSMFWHDSPHNVLAELVATVCSCELNTIMLLGDGLAPGAVAFRVVFALLSGVLKAEPKSNALESFIELSESPSVLITKAQQ